ncbi:flagellar export chaperone FliS [Psychromonas sp. Urea-02u-13]|uniref:flagellar export chaperone FliS n=1 Tax=Psychromonas sp. Urea-02u-13 TaxID=2058326 RepID=UPI000C31BB59|nr:flagellar export chaperone FliS [Psychromonas sp. Urea-02u-13]PKG39897.1 flagellar export chaperone FliS [Psychromonas sp. Urea-02u-13]
MRGSIKKYQNNNLAFVEQADPHTLISLIMQHILGNLAGAKGAIDRKEIENKNKMLGKVIGLIGELQDSLDMEKGGEISENLYNLYTYMITQVSKANFTNSPEPLTEVISLISEIKSGWDGIPQEIRQQYNK